MELLATYIDDLKRFEGFRSKAYQPAGEPASEYLTIGYGTRMPRTKALALSPMDEQEATYYLNQSLTTISKFVRSSLHAVPYALSDAQFTALVDFCYNCGVGNFVKSTLLRIIESVHFTSDDLLNRPKEEYVTAKVEDICAQFMRWNKSGGKVLPGLTNRCSWRAYLWRSRAVDALTIK